MDTNSQLLDLIRAGDSVEVLALIDSQTFKLNYVDDFWQDPLRVACEHHMYNLAMILIDHELYNYSLHDIYEYNLLMYLCRWSYMCMDNNLDEFNGVILKLIETGKFDLTYTNKYGQNLLDIIIDTCNWEMANYLSSRNDIDPDINSKSLYNLCSSDQYDTLSKLIVRWPKNAGKLHGCYSQTLLMLTSNLDFASLLIATGEIDISHVDHMGYTALMYACCGKHFDIALKLIATGKSNPKHASYINDGTSYITPLKYACDNDRIDVVFALIGTGLYSDEYILQHEFNALCFIFENKQWQIAGILLTKSIYDSEKYCNNREFVDYLENFSPTSDKTVDVIISDLRKILGVCV